MVPPRGRRRLSEDHTLYAICGNCRGMIVSPSSEFAPLGRWVHEDNGLVTCPHAPVATPVEDTIHQQDAR